MRDFAFDIEAGLFHSWSLEIVREGRNIRLLELSQTRRQLAIGGGHSDSSPTGWDIGEIPGDHVHHRAAGASQVGAVSIRRHAELLHHFVRELVRRAIAAAGLSKERIVVVAAVHQIAGLKSPDAAKGQIAIRA